MSLLQMSLSGAVLILVIIGIRAVTVDKLPKMTFLILWEIVILRLLVPFSLSAPTSVYALLNLEGLTVVWEDISFVQSARSIWEQDTESENASAGQWYSVIGAGSDEISGDTDPEIAASTGNESMGMSAGTLADSIPENSEESTPGAENAGNISDLQGVGIFSGEQGLEIFSGIQSDWSDSAVYGFLWIWIWAAGVLILAAYFLISYEKSRLKFSFSMPVENTFVNQWFTKHWAGRRVTVRQTDQISTPLTYGIVHPVILMPKTTDWTDTRQLQYIFTHECVHIRRYDALRKLACILTVCVHWFNPLVWVLYILYNRDIELACDERVVHCFGQGSRKEYSLVLLQMEAEKSGLSPFCSHFSKNSVEERITAIMKTKKTTVGIAIVSAAVVVAVAALFATTPGKGESGENTVASSESKEEAGSDAETDAVGADSSTDAVTVDFALFSITETDGFAQTASDLILLNQTPYVLVDGTIFWYEDGAWSALLDAEFSALYSGERFCGVTSDGDIDADLLAQEEYESYSLTSAGTYYNAEQVVQQSSGKKVKQLGASIFNEGVLVLYEDGTVELFTSGTAYPVAENLTVTEVSGNYLLTATGDVYLLNYVFRETSSEMSVRLKQVSSDRIESICASPTENLCVGLTDDGAVKLWTGITEQSASELTPALPASEKICLGDNYCVAVGTDGKAHFSHDDPEVGEAVDAYLEAQSSTALEVACEGQRIAVLYDDGRICMIDF